MVIAVIMSAFFGRNCRHYTNLGLTCNRVSCVLGPQTQTVTVFSNVNLIYTHIMLCRQAEGRRPPPPQRGRVQTLGDRRPTEGALAVLAVIRDRRRPTVARAPHHEEPRPRRAIGRRYF